MTLTRDQILAADDIKKERVAVPEWGGEVFVRVLSGLERDQIELGMRNANLGSDPKAQVRARYCAAAICDDAGKRLFSDADIGALGNKSGVALERVWKKALRLNRLADADVDELAKN
jgi:hypothetical protein